MIHMPPQRQSAFAELVSRCADGIEEEHLLALPGYRYAWYTQEQGDVVASVLRLSLARRVLPDLFPEATEGVFFSYLAAAKPERASAAMGTLIGALVLESRLGKPYRSDLQESAEFPGEVAARIVRFSRHGSEELSLAAVAYLDDWSERYARTASTEAVRATRILCQWLVASASLAIDEAAINKLATALRQNGISTTEVDIALDAARPLLIK